MNIESVICVWFGSVWFGLGIVESQTQYVDIAAKAYSLNVYRKSYATGSMANTVSIEIDPACRHFSQRRNIFRVRQYKNGENDRGKKKRWKETLIANQS